MRKRAKSHGARSAKRPQRRKEAYFRYAARQSRGRIPLGTKCQGRSEMATGPKKQKDAQPHDYCNRLLVSPPTDFDRLRRAQAAS